MNDDGPTLMPEPAPEMLAERVKLRDTKRQQRKTLDDEIGALDEQIDGPRPLPTVAVAVEQFHQSGERPLQFLPLPGGHAGLGDRPDTPDWTGGELLPPDSPTDRGKRSWYAFYKRWGSWWPGRLAVLVGGTGRGKSSFALQMAEAVASSGNPVLYMSAEMGTDELVARLVALRSRPTVAYGPAWSDVQMNPKHPAVRTATARLAGDCPALYLWAAPLKERNAEGLLSMLRRVVAESNGRAPFVVVDYVQRLVSGTDDRRTGVSDLSGQLRHLSRPNGDWPGAAVLALSTTARSHYELFASPETLKGALEGGVNAITKKKTPPVDLVGLGKESGELEADAPTVLCMTTADGSKAYPRAGLVVWSKNRHGERKGKAWLTFLPACGRFERFDLAALEPGRKALQSAAKMEAKEAEPAGVDAVATDAY